MHSGNQSHCQFPHSIPAYSFYGEGLWDAGTFNQASPSSLFSEARSVFPPHGNLSPVMFCFQIPTIPKPGVSSLCYLSMLLSCGDFPRLGPLWDIHNFKQNVVREIVWMDTLWLHSLCCLSIEKALETKGLLFSGLCGGSFVNLIVGAKVKSNINVELVC